MHVAVPVLLALAGCRTVFGPVDEWPESGCSAAAPDAGAGLDLRRRPRWFEARDGTRLEVLELVPRDLDCTPAIVVAPPGFHSGVELEEDPALVALAASGVRVVLYGPRGRGRSEGEEDANGPTSQDDLADLLRAVAAEDGVDPGAVLLFSRSLGSLLAAGALGRQPERLDPVGWVDYEGPAHPREELDLYEGRAHDLLVSYAAASGDPDAWWAEREPAAVVGAVDVPYHRLQGWPDHALGHYLGHAVALVAGATSSPEVRYNDLLVEDGFTEEDARDAVHEGPLDAGGDEVRDALLVALGGGPAR